MIANMQLRSATLYGYVKDLERMKQFYSDMLGVPPTNEEWIDVWAVFNRGGTRFALHAIRTWKRRGRVSNHSGSKCYGVRGNGKQRLATRSIRRAMSFKFAPPVLTPSFDSRIEAPKLG